MSQALSTSPGRPIMLLESLQDCLEPIRFVVVTDLVPELDEIVDASMIYGGDPSETPDVDEVGKLFEGCLPVISGFFMEELLGLGLRDESIFRVTRTLHLCRKDPPDPMANLLIMLLQLLEDAGQLPLLSEDQTLVRRTHGENWWPQNWWPQNWWPICNSTSTLPVRSHGAESWSLMDRLSFG